MEFYQFSSILICRVYLLLLYSLGVNSFVYYNGPVNVKEGEQFTITCGTSLFAYIKWRLNETSSSYIGDLFTVTRVDHEFISNLTVTHASLSHTGIYKCSYEEGDFGHFVTIIADNRYVIDVTHTGSICNSSVSRNTNVLICAVGKPFEEFSMHCQPTGNLESNLKLEWYVAKDNLTRPVKVKSSHAVEHWGSSLKFKSLNVTDTGNYQCHLISNGLNTSLSKVEVKLYVLPYVSGTRKDITAIEENQITLNCSVTTAVHTRVKWYLDTPGNPNSTLTHNDGRVTFESLNDTLVNNMLVINSANMSLDRGHYTCYAESDYGPSIKNMTFFVRIKSKYAALWPFIGICAEVIALCVIILIYEKKRDKTELEESDTDQGPETKSSPDHGQDNVRYRK